jgi:glycosyltransferase involved in cell wall biosynthesis
LPEEDGALLAQARRLRTLIKKEKVSLVHCHDPQAHPAAALAAKFARVPSVYTQHFRAYKHTPSWAFACDRAVVCASADLKRDLLAYHRIAAGKIHVIYNGVDVGRIDAACGERSRQHMRTQLGFGPTDYVIGNIAPCVKEEDQASLIKALKKLNSREQNAHLLIAGDGPMKEELIKVAEACGVAGHVKFIAANGDAHQLLSAVDCLALTGFNEGRPYTLLEAMAAKKPVIATAVGANKEVIEERKNGYLVPCGFPERIHSAIMRLNAIKELPAQIGEAGRKLVEEKFTIDATVNSYAELYKAIL